MGKKEKNSSSATAGLTAIRCLFHLVLRPTWARNVRVQYRRSGAFNTDELGHLLLHASSPCIIVSWSQIPLIGLKKQYKYIGGILTRTASLVLSYFSLLPVDKTCVGKVSSFKPEASERINWKGKIQDSRIHLISLQKLCMVHCTKSTHIDTLYFHIKRKRVVQK